MQCLACDFGGSSVKYALVDHRARMRDNGCCPAPLDSLTAFLDCLAQLYARFSGQAAGIALSLPGFIDAERGLHLGSGAYGPILKQQFVAKLVSARCGVPVSMENERSCRSNFSLCCIVTTFLKLYYIQPGAKIIVKYYDF